MQKQDIDIKDYYYLGMVTKPFGYKGEMVIYLDVDCPEDYAHLDSVFILQKSGLVPYFIEKISLKEKQHAVVKFADITPIQASSLASCKMFLPLEVLPALGENQFYYHEVPGYKVYDKEKGYIGVLKGILDHGPQPLFSIDNEGKEILVPMVDEFIEEVNKKEKYFKLVVPEGLIDFYLE